MAGGHGMHTPPWQILWDTFNKQAARILLEGILVSEDVFKAVFDSNYTTLFFSQQTNFMNNLVSYFKIYAIFGFRITDKF